MTLSLFETTEHLPPIVRMYAITTVYHRIHLSFVPKVLTQARLVRHIRTRCILSGQ
jgi:hypothetical protein